MRLAAVLCLLPLCAAAELTVEQQFARTALREDERPKLQKVLGPYEEQPLYRAALEVDPEERRVTGTVIITYFAKEKPLDALYLRVTPNLSKPNAVKLSYATVNGAPAVIEHPEPTLYRVKLDPVALPGTGATVEVKLSAKVPLAPHDSDQLSMDMGGLEKASADYGAFMAAPEVMSLTGLLPGVVPVKPDGTLFEGPAGLGDLSSFEPALYMVSVEVPRSYEVVAAGAALGEVPRPDGHARFSFAHAGARDFPLFVTKGYAKTSVEMNGITVESWHLKSDADAGKRVATYAAQALEVFEKRFGPYPWTTFRVVEARLTGGAGGMEFPGLVSVSTALYRGASNPLSALGLGGELDALGPLKDMLKGLDQMMETTLEFTVAHEVAHQWFAMMVGSDPIGEPAADEPLTQHAALLYLEDRHGKAAANGMRDAQLKMAYQLHRALGGKDGTVERPTSDFDTSGEYGAIIYGKAPLLFDALRAKVGDATHFKALRAYCDENRFRWTTTDGVFKAFVRAGGSAAAVSALRKHWWQQKNGDADLGQGELAGLLQGLAGGGQGGAGLQGLPSMDSKQMQQLEQLMKDMEQH